MFSYEPLPDGQIRLLTFTNDSGLNCTVGNYPLLDGLKYVALSYTWGRAAYQKGRSPDDVYRITVNDEAFAVQQNLHDALRQLGRFVYGRRTRLWVDAICIDQSNNSEKRQQVSLMTDIYRRAAAVYAWLGLPFDDGETKSAISLMESFHVHLRDGLRTHEGDMNVIKASIDADTVGFPGPDRPGSVEAWDGIAEILNQRYWRRTWIYQEATAPGEIWFCCGGHCFNDTFLSATVFFGSTFANLPAFPRRFSVAANSASNAFKLNSARIAREKKQGSTLLSLMLAYRHTQCQDPRDKVFASMGLASDIAEPCDPLLQIDYSRSVVEVYVNVMHFMIERHGLSVLCYVIAPACDGSHPALSCIFEPTVPSWAIDWRRTAIVHPFDPRHEGYDGEHCYNACLGMDGVGAERQIEGTTLLVNGCVIDSVSLTTSIWDDDESSYGTLKDWKDLLRHPGVDSFNDSFDRLLVADVKKHEVDGRIKHVRDNSVDWQLVDTPPTTLGPAQRRQWDLLTERMEAVCRGRRAGRTAQCSLVMLPAATAVGDQIAVLYGSRILHVIRSDTDRPDYYHYVGECYVDSMMDGQAMNPSIQKRNMSLLRLV